MELSLGVVVTNGAPRARYWFMQASNRFIHIETTKDSQVIIQFIILDFSTSIIVAIVDKNIPLI